MSIGSATRRNRATQPTKHRAYQDHARYDAFGQLAAEYSSTDPTGTTETHYLTTDHLGSTRLVTNQNGAVVSRHDYLPFGWELYSGLTGRTSGHGYLTSPEGVHTPTQRFTGKERDSETRLDYFGARHYSAGPGRFTSADAPFADQHTDDPQSWNLYSYVRNNPLAFVDSTGRCLHPYQAAQCGIGLGQRRMTPKEAEYTAKGVAIGTGAAASVAAGPGILAWGGALVRAAIGWALGHPQEVQDVAVAVTETALGMEGPGTPTLTGNLAKLSQVELSTGTALAARLGRNLSVSEHVGAEFVDAMGKTYDAMGSAKAFQHPKFDIGKFAGSMLDHFRKSNDHTVIDLRGATKDQTREIRRRAGDIAGSSDHFIFIE